MKYEEFIEAKKHSIGSFGFKANFIPDMAFDFQRHIITKALQKGRIGIFADTGLGKTLIQLSLAQNVILTTNKNVLILTPLAVAFQFLEEAEKLGIDDIEHSKDGKFTKKIVVCNYERLHYFNADDFECVILDESSILKNFNGKIKEQITSFIKKVPYRFLSTATPSPNDFIELGTSSEALGYMGYMDMLTKFFKNNQNSVDSNNRNIGEKFYLKPHAEKDFFAWVNQWSIMVKKPSDIGFSDDGYDLPQLIKNYHSVENQSLIDINGQVQLLTPIAKSMTEVRYEQQQTIKGRCELAVQLAEGKTSVYWCNFNEESALLKELDSDAVEIIGSMSIDKKEDILINFAKGNIDRIITKAKMTSMGLNWQHCNHSVFFPTWSYEQYYQAIRRFWRFGQKRDVTIDIVASDGQERVLEALEQKTQKAILLHQNLVNANESNFTADELWEHLNEKFIDHQDPKSNKLSHYIWQRYASSVWDDIRIDNVLPFRDSKEEDDEKHVHPLQLDVIDRIIELYSNPGEVILTPFMGVGSEVFSPVSLGRKAIGIELKDSYYKQAILNMKEADKRFNEVVQKTGELF